MKECVFESSADGSGIHKSLSVSGWNQKRKVLSARRERSRRFYRAGEKSPLLEGENCPTFNWMFHPSGEVDTF